MHGLKESTTLSTRLLLFNTRESRYLTLKKIISTCYYQQQQKTIRLLTRKREKGKLDKYDQKREESELFSRWRRSALPLFHHQPYPSLSICDSAFQVCVRSPLHSTPNPYSLLPLHWQKSHFCYFQQNLSNSSIFKSASTTAETLV